MDGRKATYGNDPEDWFPIEVVLAGILVRIQKGDAVDIDRWFCRSVFDRISQRGYGMEPRPLMRQVLAWSPYRISRWVDMVKGRYLFDSDIEIACKLLEAEAQAKASSRDLNDGS
jgi:hypothetical protein